MSAINNSSIGTNLYTGEYICKSGTKLYLGFEEINSENRNDWWGFRKAGSRKQVIVPVVPKAESHEVQY